MKQGIIFDMDGTLWDSTVGVAESWNEILKQEKVNRTPLTVEDFRIWIFWTYSPSTFSALDTRILSIS